MRDSIQNLVPYDAGMTHEQLEDNLGKKIIKLSANESLWGPPPSVRNALQNSFAQLKFYPDGVAEELKKALCKLWALPVENFCLGNGADEVIQMLATAFLNPGDEVVIPTPTFSSYASSVTINGGKVTFVPQKELVLNLEEIAASLHPHMKMVFLCNPNNPTGTFFSHTDFEQFLQKVPPEILVVLDEAYCQYATEPNFPRSSELLRKYANLIILRTFSKVYSLAALRIGYAVAGTEVIRELEKIRQPYNVNTLAQIAATAALQDEQYTQKVIKETVQEREWLTKELRQRGLTVLSSQANFLLIKVKNATIVCKKLLEEGILVRNTASFGLPEWLRVTIGPHQYMEQFVKSLDTVLSD